MTNKLRLLTLSIFLITTSVFAPVYSASAPVTLLENDPTKFIDNSLSLKFGALKFENLDIVPSYSFQHFLKISNNRPLAIYSHQFRTKADYQSFLFRNLRLDGLGTYKYTRFSASDEHLGRNSLHLGGRILLTIPEVGISLGGHLHTELSFKTKKTVSFLAYSENRFQGALGGSVTFSNFRLQLASFKRGSFNLIPEVNFTFSQNIIYQMDLEAASLLTNFYSLGVWQASGGMKLEVDYQSEIGVRTTAQLPLFLIVNDTAYKTGAKVATNPIIKSIKISTGLTLLIKFSEYFDFQVFYQVVFNFSDPQNRGYRFKVDDLFPVFENAYALHTSGINLHFSL